MNIYKSNLLLVQRTNNHLTANPQRGKKSPNLQQGGQEGAETRDARVPKPSRRSCSSSAHWGTSSWSPGTHRCPRWRRGVAAPVSTAGPRDTRTPGRPWGDEDGSSGRACPTGVSGDAGRTPGINRTLTCFWSSKHFDNTYDMLWIFPYKTLKTFSLFESDLQEVFITPSFMCLLLTNTREIRQMRQFKLSPYLKVYISFKVYFQHEKS